MSTSPSRAHALPWVSLATLAAVGFAMAGFVAAWTQALPPVLGDPSLGGAAVAASLLTGLLLGGRFGGQRASKLERPALVLGRFLIGAGATAVAAFVLLSNLERLYAVLVRGFHGPAVSTAAGAALVFAVLVVPAFIIGVTITLDWRLGGIAARTTRASGCFFGCMMLGLAGGTAASAYGLMPGIGALGTVAVSAGLLIVAGVVAQVTRETPDSREADAAAESPCGSAARSSSSGPGRYLEPAAYAVFVASGVACAVVWTHLLSQIAGGTVYKTAAVYCVFFGGGALGSAVAGSLAHRVAGGRFWLGLFAAAAGILWLAPVLFVDRLPHLFLRFLGLAAGIYPPQWRDAVFSYFGLSLLLVFLPGMLMGATLPFASRALSSDRHAPSRASGSSGPVISLAIAGGLAAILLGHLVPRPGLASRTVLMALPWFAVTTGCVAIATSHRRLLCRLAPVVLLAGTTLAIDLAAPAWNRGALTGGVYEDPEKFLGMNNLQAALAATDVVFYEEDGDRAVSVIRSADGLFLKIDGRTALSSEETQTQALAAHIPMLLGQNPRRVLAVGVGTGQTLRSIEAYGASDIECVEPLAAAVAAAGRFSPYNGGALEDARLKVIHADPLNYLMVTSRTYDVVVGGQSGTGTGFARLARRRLNPGGIAAQILNFDRAGEGGFKSAVREFQAYFPAVELWWTGGTDVLLVAGTQPLETRAETLALRMGPTEVREDLARVGIEDETALAACRVMGGQALAAWTGGARAEGLWAKGIARRDAPQLLLRLDSAAASAAAAGADQSRAGYPDGDRALTRCTAARGDFFRALAAFRDRKFGEATRYLENAAATCTQNRVFAFRLCDLYVSYSRELAGSARFQDALGAARRAIEANPGSHRAFYNLASVERRRDPSACIALLRRATELNPDYVPAYLFEAEVQLAMGDIDAAGGAVSRALSIEPFNAEAHHLRALCLTHKGLFDDARRDLEFTLRADPRNADAPAAIGYTWLLQSNLDKSARYYRKVLKIDPSHPDGLNNLAAILAEKDQYGTAIKLWEKALELNPGNPDIKRNISEARKKMDQS